MSTSHPTSACFYSLKGKLTISRAGWESVVPLDCICPRQEQVCTKCAECGRFFHAACNERVEGDLGSIIVAQEDGSAQDNVLGSHSAPCDGGDTGVPHRDEHPIVCFPCKHPRAT
eukprot:scaffold1725_cov355-Pavlova_lutheri.AAC.3